MSAAQRLAQTFVEGTTDRDYADLPDVLRADLDAWCTRFLAWTDPPVVAGEVVGCPVPGCDLSAGHPLAVRVIDWRPCR